MKTKHFRNFAFMDSTTFSTAYL